MALRIIVGLRAEFWNGSPLFQVSVMRVDGLWFNEWRALSGKGLLMKHTHAWYRRYLQCTISHYTAQLTFYLCHANITMENGASGGGTLTVSVTDDIFAHKWQVSLVAAVELAVVQSTDVWLEMDRHMCVHHYTADDWVISGSVVVSLYWLQVHFHYSFCLRQELRLCQCKYSR